MSYSASELAVLLGTGPRNFTPIVGEYYNAGSTGGALTLTRADGDTTALAATERVIVLAFHFHLGTAGIGGIYFDLATDVYVCRGSFAANGGVSLEGLWVGQVNGPPTCVTSASGDIAATISGFVQERAA